jgi:hypothetical protein
MEELERQGREIMAVFAQVLLALLRAGVEVDRVRLELMEFLGNVALAVLVLLLR